MEYIFAVLLSIAEIALYIYLLIGLFSSCI